MGGEIFELPSEKIKREAVTETKLEDARALIKYGHEDQLSEDTIRNRLKSSFGLSDEVIDQLYREYSLMNDI